MIPTIGYMIGAYIFTRMIQIIVTTEAKRGKIFLKICAILTAIVAVGGIAFLLYQEISGVLALQGLQEKYLIK